jgi:hypothetical protein
MRTPPVRRPLLLHSCGLLLAGAWLLPPAVHAQSVIAQAAGLPQTTGLSQAQMEADCLRRLAPLMQADAEVKGVDFSALGQYASYYVVTWRFKADLRHGARSATCTYRREGQWVRDDAHAYRQAR